MNDIIFKAIELLVLIVFTLISSYLIPWLKTKVDFAKLELAYNWTETFVQAAENIAKGKGLGQEKKATVISLLKDKLNELKINMTDEQIESLIEEAVAALWRKEKEAK